MTENVFTRSAGMMAGRLQIGRLLSTWLPPLIATLCITWESTPTFSAAHTSGWLRPLFEHWFGHINDTLWWWMHHVFRKSGHFCGYGLVCLTFLRAWLRTLPGGTGWMLRAAGLAVACTAVVASLDEWHQTYLPSRTGAVSDVGIDVCGAVLACLLVAVLVRGRMRLSGAAVTAS